MAARAYVDLERWRDKTKAPRADIGVTLKLRNKEAA